ncbi:hypothetical protein niasHS_000649 [Heterodera schachtii]|uniref:Chromatin target of PRMT1 protein C-terminal domain-containing protein n=1 Tax=Heterodera schachtii TaxID=97005 RepID=A0ABD2K5L9_HETSC
MNNAVDSVPARIVIIGTSKMRLSERFNKLQKAPPPPPPQAPQQQVFLKRESINGVAIGPVISRPRVIDERDRPENRIQNSRSFLHDDYMDNDLYGDFVEPFLRRPQMGGFRSANLYEGFQPAPDPLKLTLDAYDQYSRFRSSHRRSIHSRITETSMSRFRNLPVYDESEDALYGDYDEPPRSRMYNQNDYNRRPIHQRLSFKPMRLSGYDFMRRPLHRHTTQFKRPFYNRGSHFSFNRWRTNDWNRRGAPMPFGRRGRWGDNKRMKKSLAEMDRELEEYMRSSKHPRVKLTKAAE